MKKLLLLILISHIVSSVSAEPSRVVLRSDSFPNYVFALLSTDRSTASGVLLESDSQYLDLQRGALQFANGAMGPLAPVFVFLPIYVRPDSPAGAEEYYRLLSEAVSSGDPAPFTTHYAKELAEVHRFIPYDFAQDCTKLGAMRSQVRELSRIFASGYSAYLAKSWPEIDASNKKIAQRLQPLVDDENLVERWQARTGVTFGAPVYEIELCPSLQGVSNAVSPAIDRNHFWVDGDDQNFLLFLSHEVGTHLLGGWYAILPLTARYSFADCYAAYESLASYYNLGIGGRLVFQNYSGDKFQDLYARIEKAEPKIAPPDLLAKGLAEFTTGH